MWLSSIILKLSKLPKAHLWSMYLKCSIILHLICTFLSPELLLPGSYILISRWRVFPQAGSKCYRLPEIEFYDCVTLYDIAPLWSFSMIVIPAWFIANNLWIEKVFKGVFRKKPFCFSMYTFWAKRLFSVWYLTVQSTNQFATCAVFHLVCCELLPIYFIHITQWYFNDTHWLLLDFNGNLKRGCVISGELSFLKLITDEHQMTLLMISQHWW